MDEKQPAFTPTGRILARLDPTFGEGSPATELDLGIQPVSTLEELLQNGGGRLGGWIVTLTTRNRLEIEAEIAGRESENK